MASRSEAARTKLGSHVEHALDKSDLTKAAPLEHMVCVHAMCPRNLGHARTRLQGLPHNLKLLRNLLPPSAPRAGRQSVEWNHAPILIGEIGPSPDGTFGRLRFAACRFA